MFDFGKLLQYAVQQFQDIMDQLFYISILIWSVTEFGSHLSKQYIFEISHMPTIKKRSL